MLFVIILLRKYKDQSKRSKEKRVKRNRSSSRLERSGMERSIWTDLASRSTSWFSTSLQSARSAKAKNPGTNTGIANHLKTDTEPSSV